MDLQTMIDTAEHNHQVFIDSYDEDRVWLSVMVPGGTAHVTLTHEQALEVIAAINRVLESQ